MDASVAVNTEGLLPGDSVRERLVANW